MATVSYIITGRSPLLMHNPAGSMQVAVEGGIRSRKVPTPEAEAKAATYEQDGILVVKSIAVRNSMLLAAQRGGFTTTLERKKAAVKPLIAAVVLPLLDWFPLRHPLTHQPLPNVMLPADDTTGIGWKLDVQRAVVKRQGILRARPRIDAWQLQAEFEYDETLMAENVITSVLSFAGHVVGIGDQRPGAPLTPGSYGRFSVQLIE